MALTRWDLEREGDIGRLQKSPILPDDQIRLQTLPKNVKMFSAFKDVKVI